jgi:hypothetical protein
MSQLFPVAALYQQHGMMEEVEKMEAEMRKTI